MVVFVVLGSGRPLRAVEPQLAMSDAIAGGDGAALLQVDFVAAGQNVSAVQFDIGCPASLSIASISLADAAAGSKQLWVADLPGGLKRVLIAGTNATSMENGPMLQLLMQTKAGTAAGSYPVTIGAVSAADSIGSSITLAAANGSVIVAGPGMATSVVRAVVNAADWAGGAVSPGEIVVIGGDLLAGEAFQGAQLASDGRIGTALAGARVLFDGTPAPLLYTTARQISAIVPYAVERRAETAVQIEREGVRSAPLKMAVISTVPGIFTVDESGTGQAAIANGDGSINGPGRPAAPGSVVVIFATGEGQTSPPGVDGSIATSGNFCRPVLPVAATIGGVDAEVLYAGSAGLQVAGLLQVNVKVPSAVTPGDRVPVLLNVGGRNSQSGVTMAVR